jgi:Fe-S-cluster containining protein
MHDARPRWEARGDGRLLRRVDAALAAGARRASGRLACRVGCTECCLGPFPVTWLDARRLAAGLAELAEVDPRRADAIRARAHDARRAMRLGFPGDPATGRLSEDEVARERFFDRHGSLPCPVLDPRTGACELYAARPLGCRSYGPPVRVAGEDLPPCRLCFVGAKAAEVERCRVAIDPGDEEDALLRRLHRAGEPGAVETLVAHALAPRRGPARARRKRAARRRMRR